MQTGVTMNAKRGITNPDKRPIAGLQTTSGDSIDSLAWHLVILGIACMIGWSLRAILIVISPDAFCTFPLFPLCMMAGLFMQIVLQKCDQRYRMVDRATMERISGTGLDFLIVGAIAMVNVNKLRAEIFPFLVLCLVGIATEVACVLYLSPIMNPICWFENAICCFGQDTGVIAAGLMLLRMVDPDERTPVPKAFGYKQPIHSGLMGGGLVTASWITVQKSLGLGWTTLVTFLVVVLVMVMWYIFIKPQFAEIRGKYETLEDNIPDTQGNEEMLLPGSEENSI